MRDPLVRTAWPLLINIGSNGVLGVAYWLVAARLYDPDAVATNAALLAAMMTLSGITQLNLGQTLPVFVPRAGARARRVVAQVYGTVTAFAVLVLVGFYALVLPHLPSLSAVLNSPARLAAFAVGVLAFNIFALQDAALISLRRQKLVPLENAAFGVAKLLLLLPLLVLLPDLGIWVSWVVPLAVLVPVVSFVVFGRRAADGPSRAKAGPARQEPLSKLLADYAGYLFLIGSSFMLPLVAFELLTPLEAAVFAIAWQTSSTVDLLASNVGTAVTVETAYGREPAALRRAMLRLALPVVCGIAVLAALVAPLILSLYGEDYREEGVLTLRLLLLAGIPRCLATFAIAEARAHREIGFIVRLRAQNFLVALVLSVLLAPEMGVSGMAVAWLVAQVLSGAVALRRLLVWSPTAPASERMAA